MVNHPLNLKTFNWQRVVGNVGGVVQHLGKKGCEFVDFCVELPTPPKSKTSWKLPMFNRKYILIRGGFSFPVMLVFRGGGG